MVGRRQYGAGGKFLDPFIPGFTTILCLTPSSPYGPISPYSLKDAEGRLMENIWQFAKIYETVPVTKQRYSRYSQRVIWEHGAERHLTAAGTPTPAYWAWRAKGMHCECAIRYPVGFGHRHACRGALTGPDTGHCVKPEPEAEADENVRQAQAEAKDKQPPKKKARRELPLLSYIDSRRQIYLPVYARLLQGHPLFCSLQAQHRRGVNLLIVEVDGPHRESLDYYRAKYPAQVAAGFTITDNECVEATETAMTLLLNDPKHPFGHGYCLAMAVMGKARAWNRSLAAQT